jgi:hypothetical protein
VAALVRQGGEGYRYSVGDHVVVRAALLCAVAGVSTARVLGRRIVTGAATSSVDPAADRRGRRVPTRHRRPCAREQRGNESEHPGKRHG